MTRAAGAAVPLRGKQNNRMMISCCSYKLRWCRLQLTERARDQAEVGRCSGMVWYGMVVVTSYDGAGYS